MRSEFAVVGGDERMARLAALLEAAGHGAVRFAGAPPPGIRAGCAILPLPLSARDGYLNAPEAPSPVPLAEVFSALAGVPLVFAGRADAASRALAREAGIELLDYYEREELAVLNAAATAEGALAIAMRETAGTLCVPEGHFTSRKGRSMHEVRFTRRQAQFIKKSSRISPAAFGFIRSFSLRRAPCSCGRSPC